MDYSWILEAIVVVLVQVLFGCSYIRLAALIAEGAWANFNNNIQAPITKKFGHALNYKKERNIRS